MPYVNVDHLAENLRSLGSIGRSMPPAWDGAKIAHPVISPHGDFFGRMLPGRGLYLDMDLKTLGIHKSIPNVFEKSKVMRLYEVLRSERWAIGAAALLTAAALLPKSLLAAPAIIGAIQTYDGLFSARGNNLGFDVVFFKNSFTTVGNVWFSTFLAGGNPSAGAYTNIPGGAAMDNTSPGSLILPVPNPTGGNKAYLLTLGYTCPNALNTALFADLLVAAGNISATIATLQTVNTTALTRYTTGVGVNAILDTTTLTGATAQTITLIYTNSAGTGSRSTGAQAMTASSIVQRLNPGATAPFCPLASGDFGIQSVQSAQFSAGNTAGVVALNLFYPLTFIPGISANVWVERDLPVQFSGLKEIAQSAGAVLGCWTVFLFANTTTSGLVTGMARTCQG